MNGRLHAGGCPWGLKDSTKPLELVGGVLTAGVGGGLADERNFLRTNPLRGASVIGLLLIAGLIFGN
jgi:hypothetical protein